MINLEAVLADDPRSYDISDDGSSITCRLCQMTSHNATDVTKKYCGNCNIFHEEIMLQIRLYRRVRDRYGSGPETLTRSESSS